MKILNTHAQLTQAVKDGVITREQSIAISYHRYESRDLQANASKVWSPFFALYPEGHWRDRGAKSFVGDKKESLPLAMEWAVKTYGELNLVRNRMGDYVPKIVNDIYPLSK
jgi:hypothetical protein